MDIPGDGSSRSAERPILNNLFIFIGLFVTTSGVRAFPGVPKVPCPRREQPDEDAGRYRPGRWMDRRAGRPPPRVVAMDVCGDRQPAGMHPPWLLGVEKTGHHGGFGRRKIAEPLLQPVRRTISGRSEDTRTPDPHPPRPDSSTPKAVPNPSFAPE